MRGGCVPVARDDENADNLSRDGGRHLLLHLHGAVGHGQVSQTLSGPPRAEHSRKDEKRVSGLDLLAFLDADLDDDRRHWKVRVSLRFRWGSDRGNALGLPMDPGSDVAFSRRTVSIAAFLSSTWTARISPLSSKRTSRMPVSVLTGLSAISLMMSVLPWSITTWISSPMGGFARK